MPHWLKWAWGGISLRVHLHVSSEGGSVACAARSKCPLRLLLGGMKISIVEIVLSSLQLTCLCTPFAGVPTRFSKLIQENFSSVLETYLVDLSSRDPLSILCRCAAFPKKASRRK